MTGRKWLIPKHEPEVVDAGATGASKSKATRPRQRERGRSMSAWVG